MCSGSVKERRPLHAACTGAPKKRGTTLIRLRKTQPSAARQLLPGLGLSRGRPSRTTEAFVRATPGGEIHVPPRRLAPAAGSLKRPRRDASHHRLFLVAQSALKLCLLYRTGGKMSRWFRGFFGIKAKTAAHIRTPGEKSGRGAGTYQQSRKKFTVRSRFAP